MLFLFKLKNVHFVMPSFLLRSSVIVADHSVCEV